MIDFNPKNWNADTWTLFIVAYLIGMVFSWIGLVIGVIVYFAVKYNSTKEGSYGSSRVDFKGEQLHRE